MRKTAVFFAMAVAAFSQTATFQEGSFHGRRAFVLENDRMRVSTLPGGGFIGEARFKSDDPKKSVNPMRVPDYQTIDPYAYDIVRDGPTYGTGMQRRLQSGYMGHFLCFPHFGPATQAELDNDYGHHGEALAVEWKRQRVDIQNDRVILSYGADLPKTQFRVQRTITLPADETVAYVEESVENLTVYNRPVQWVQHVTFGPPFLEIGKSFVDASIDRVARPGRGGPGLAAASWTNVAGTKADITDFRVFSGTGAVWLMDRSRPKVYFTIYNADYPVLIGYIFSSADNPWVLDYQANRPQPPQTSNPTQRPGGRTVARGLCIGDSPVEGQRTAIETGKILGVPVHSWIDSRQRRTQAYAFFLAEIPLGYKGVAKLRIEDGRIILVERETGSTIAIKSALLR